ncbi:MAG: hypothetical protein NC110_03745 [Ruminococcus sp.]|nr:hypothetical protein [Ruminococcus sp.]
MKRFLCSLMLAVLMFNLCACTKSEFMQLSAFIENYNRHQTEQPLGFTDLLATTNSGQTFYNCFFSCGKNSVALRIIEDENKKIEQCRVILPKLDEKGKPLTLTDDMISLFCKTAANTLAAFTLCTSEQAQAVINEFALTKPETFSAQGELTKQSGSFYYVYLSNSLVSEFIIYNKWLHEIESTNKPVSKVAYADTTKIRDETVPLR